MNVFKRIGCRIYQKVMYCAMPFLPWRKPELVDGGLAALPNFIKGKGFDKVLLVTDKGIRSLGLINNLLDGLEKTSIKCFVYDETVANPTIDNIEAALKIYNGNGCKAIIAFGGGSAMDCGKGVGARVARPNKPVQKMKGVLKILKATPPIFAVPTTAGTGSEATLAAVISNSQTHEKYPINDPNLIPKYAVLDPQITVKLPKHITSTTGIDALTHAVEAFIGSSNTKETKQMAVDATKLIFKYLKRAYDNGEDIEARKQMQLAAYYAGISFTRAYVGYVHSVAHSLGGYYGVPHGLANAVLLPYFLDEYGSTAWKKLAILADAVGVKGKSDEEKAKAFIQAIKDLNASMDIPTKIDKIQEKDIPILSARASSEGNPLYPVPKLMDKNEL
ncbi:MAG: iron-containing alcohol dehydrogenase, partial [Clostridia bacterium]